MLLVMQKPLANMLRGTRSTALLQPPGIGRDPLGVGLLHYITRLERRGKVTAESIFFRVIQLFLRFVGGFLVRFLRLAKRLFRMFHRELRLLVSAPMLFLTVMGRGGAMGVRGEFMKLSGDLMRIVWHSVSMVAPPTCL